MPLVDVATRLAPTVGLRLQTRVHAQCTANGCHRSHTLHIHHVAPTYAAVPIRCWAPLPNAHLSRHPRTRHTRKHATMPPPTHSRHVWVCHHVVRYVYPQPSDREAKLKSECSETHVCLICLTWKGCGRSENMQTGVSCGTRSGWNY